MNCISYFLMIPWWWPNDRTGCSWSLSLCPDTERVHLNSVSRCYLATSEAICSTGNSASHRGFRQSSRRTENMVPAKRRCSLIPESGNKDRNVCFCAVISEDRPRKQSAAAASLWIENVSSVEDWLSGDKQKRQKVSFNIKLTVQNKNNIKSKCQIQEQKR